MASTISIKHIQSRNYIHNHTSNNAMKNIKEIVDELNLGSDVCFIRNDIADLMEHYLQRGKRADKDAALPYFINAIGSLALNINSPRDTTPVGLYTCLADLDKAIAGLEENAAFDMNPKSASLKVKSIEHITYEFLIDALIALRGTSAFHGNRTLAN
ncbi:MAG: hypothetical protein ACXWIN_08110 [Burkholderiaceae bacterium]